MIVFRHTDFTAGCLLKVKYIKPLPVVKLFVSIQIMIAIDFTYNFLADSHQMHIGMI